MELLTDLDLVGHPKDASCVSIGVYDGVHVGHHYVIDQLCSRAKTLGLPAGVVTFDRHPMSVVAPQAAPKLLTDLEQRLELLAQTDIDFCVVVRFDERRSLQSAESFVSDTLVAQLGVKVVAVGRDFHFGRRRLGNIELLATLGASLDFELLDVELRQLNGLSVSSTRIRELLGAGAVNEAAVLLGRDHEIRGLVELGDQRGRELGFPTANVGVPGDILVPAEGTYAGSTITSLGSFASAISIGRRSTFYADAASLVESHLLGFSGDLYDQRVRVQFRDFMRPQMTFDGVTSLVAQIEADCEQARLIMHR